MSEPPAARNSVLRITAASRKPSPAPVLRALGIVLLLCGFFCARIARAAESGIPTPHPRSAATALLVDSDLEAALRLTTATLARNPDDREAWFVRMEAAALASDVSTELEAALRLCELAPNHRPAMIAAARIAELATNTGAFRAALPSLEKLVLGNPQESEFLSRALLNAAADGAATAPVAQLARQAGLLTEWRVAGPFGHFSAADFDRSFIPTDVPASEGLARPSYGGRSVESFRFDSGEFNLPEYFSQAGVFYAESSVNLATPGQYRLRVESEGTLEISIDGNPALAIDDRFFSTAGINSTVLELPAGQHRVFVKFIPSAAPFRISLRPSANPIASPPQPGLLADYQHAEARFWMRDYAGAISELGALERHHPSAAVEYLLAQAWSRASDESPEAPALLESALKRSPQSLAAAYELAARAYDAERYEDSYSLAKRVIAVRPGFAPAQQLLADSAWRLGFREEAQPALVAGLKLHPSCGALLAAARIFAATGDYPDAGKATDALSTCAPASLAYPQALAAQGRHREAALAAAQVADEYPLDRLSRALAAREFATAGEPKRALLLADDLAAMAPNSADYRDLRRQIEAGHTVFDSASTNDDAACGPQLNRADLPCNGTEFFTPYRRSGLDIIHQTSQRHFAGGEVVVLLDDRVVQLSPRGAVALYVHRILRVLNREGIERYGEVELPAGAEVLELRTIAQDGTIAEPEFSPDKNTISMPALAPGSAIEQEYVVRYPSGGVDEHAEAFRFAFGSFAAPILYARFVALSPAGAAGQGEAGAVQVMASDDAPAPAFNRVDNTEVRRWERENIMQFNRESALPPAEVLPSVRLMATHAGGWRYYRDRYRNDFLEATRVGPRTRATAEKLRGANPEATARSFYHLVTAQIRGDEADRADGDLTPAENTLADYAGSRAATLLALARAAGLDADLLLARDLAQLRPSQPEARTYMHPLVRFRFGDHSVVTAPDSTGLAFGVLPSSIAREEALLVTLSTDVSEKESSFVSLQSIPAADEQSVAQGELRFDAEGNLTAAVTIRMGTARGMQMRSILSGIAPADRRQFFQQLALRLFKGAGDADGEVIHEDDAEQSLELRVTCRVPHFANFEVASTDLDQLAPALGLRKIYGLGPRHFPLYVAIPLVETTTFQVHLPAGVQVRALPGDFAVKTPFGSYSARFRQTPGGLEVRRAFNIPAQLIAADRFADFAQLARQIDEAERQRFTLESSLTSSRKRAR